MKRRFIYMKCSFKKIIRMIIKSNFPMAIKQTNKISAFIQKR